MPLARGGDGGAEGGSAWLGVGGNWKGSWIQGRPAARRDGSGYPTGLAGEDIPLNARIVSVADAFDAMTSGRVYQKAVSNEDACRELQRCSGTHFDPQCVDAFVTALDRVKDVAPRRVEVTAA